MPPTPVTAQPSVIRAIIEDTRWGTHAAPAPRNTPTPFVAFWKLEPLRDARSVCLEDWGRWRDRYRLLCYHDTPAQADWLLGQIAAKFSGFPEWDAEDVEPLFEDPTDAPPLWVRPLTVVLTPT